MRFWSIDGTEDSVLMIVHWLDIVLIVESVIEYMVILMVHFMTVLVLICRVAAFMILINAV